MLKRILATIGLGASLIALPSAASAQSGHSFHFRSQSHMPPPGFHFRGRGFGSGHGFVTPGHRFRGPRHHFFAPRHAFRFDRPPHHFRGHFPRRFRGHFRPPPEFFFRGQGFGHGFGGGHVIIFVGPGCC
jgi:hypothetical protein